MNLFDDAGFDDPTVLLIEERQQELLYGGRAVSTSETRARYAVLKKKRLGDTWYEGGGRYLYRMGPQGVTVFDTDRLWSDA